MAFPHLESQLHLNTQIIYECLNHDPDSHSSQRIFNQTKSIMNLQNLNLWFFFHLISILAKTNKGNHDHTLIQIHLHNRQRRLNSIKDLCFDLARAFIHGGSEGYGK